MPTQQLEIKAHSITQLTQTAELSEVFLENRISVDQRRTASRRIA